MIKLASVAEKVGLADLQLLRLGRSSQDAKRRDHVNVGNGEYTQNRQSS